MALKYIAHIGCFLPSLPFLSFFFVFVFVFVFIGEGGGGGGGGGGRDVRNVERAKTTTWRILRTFRHAGTAETGDYLHPHLPRHQDKKPYGLYNRPFVTSSPCLPLHDPSGTPPKFVRDSTDKITQKGEYATYTLATGDHILLTIKSSTANL